MGLLALGQSPRGGLVAAADPGLALGSTEPNLKVAFIGDQGDGSDALAVLQLIANEGADAVLHQGDFDYGGNPTQWDNDISSVLGIDFPYFASVGNHDAGDFYGTGGYQEKLLARLARVESQAPQDVSCTGDLGVNSACVYKGLFFVLSGVGTLGSGHVAYLDQALAADQSAWRVCSWHKNQNAMQIGGKGNEVGWPAYETCRTRGAIIATAHEHSYSRTKTLVSMQNQTVDSTWPSPTDLRLAPGATFAFVSGLGGQSIRDQERCLPTTYPYGCKGEWASIYSSSQGARSGALFIEFGVDGNPNKARGYFKNVNGVVIDTFEITSQMVTVDPSNNAPVVQIVSTSPDAPDEGESVTVSAGFTDDVSPADRNDTHSASINWGDGSVTAGVVSETAGSGTGTVSGTHAYRDNGSYTVTVTVGDFRGGAGSGNATATVDNLPPAANAGGPYSAVVGTPVSLTGSATDPGTADVLTYEWDLSYDGTFNAEVTGQTVQATFASEGAFAVALRVLDDEGEPSAVSVATVNVAARPPVRLYLSLGSSATLSGLAVANEDIVAFDGTGFSMYFDGSDVGAGSFTLDAFAILSPTEILVSFTAAGTVGGVAMDDSDILKFTGTFGPTTSGTFSMYFDGSDVGLSTSDEDVDAIELLPDGRLLVSTLGSVSVTGVSSGQDEDLLVFTPTSLGSNTAGTWALYFDGSDVGLSSSDEDLDAVAVDATGRIYLSTTGSFSVTGLSGADEDVFVFTPSSLGGTTAGTFGPGLFFDGSLYGLSGNDVFAIDLP
jgi:hypothetical protein